MKAESLFASCVSLSKEEKGTVYDSRCHIENKTFKRKKGVSCGINLGLIQLPHGAAFLQSWLDMNYAAHSWWVQNKHNILPTYASLSECFQKQCMVNHQKGNLLGFCIIMISFRNVDRQRGIFNTPDIVSCNTCSRILPLDL